MSSTIQRNSWRIITPSYDHDRNEKSDPFTCATFWCCSVLITACSFDLLRPQSCLQACPLVSQCLHSTQRLPATGFSPSITSSADHTSAVIRSELITLPHLGMPVPIAGAWNSALHSSGQHNSPSNDACSATCSSVAPSMPIKHSNLPRLHKLSASVLTHTAPHSVLPQGGDSELRCRDLVSKTT